MCMAYQDKYRLIVLLRRLLPSQSCSKKLIRKNPEFALTPGRPLLLSTPPRSTTVLQQFLTEWNNPHLFIVVCKIQLLFIKTCGESSGEYGSFGIWRLHQHLRILALSHGVHVFLLIVADVAHHVIQRSYHRTANDLYSMERKSFICNWIVVVVVVIVVMVVVFYLLSRYWRSTGLKLIKYIHISCFIVFLCNRGSIHALQYLFVRLGKLSVCIHCMRFAYLKYEHHV